MQPPRVILNNPTGQRWRIKYSRENNSTSSTNVVTSARDETGNSPNTTVWEKSFAVTPSVIFLETYTSLCFASLGIWNQHKEMSLSFHVNKAEHLSVARLSTGTNSGFLPTHISQVVPVPCSALQVCTSVSSFLYSIRRLISQHSRCGNITFTR